MEAKSLIVSDLDGTALDPGGRLSLGFESVVEDFAELGYAFAVATARCPHDVERIFASSPANFIAMCSDGALVCEFLDSRFTDVMHESFLSADDVVAVANALLASSHRVDLIAFCGSAHDFEVVHASRDNRYEAARILREELEDLRPSRLVSEDEWRERLQSSDVRALSVLERTQPLQGLAHELRDFAPHLKTLFYVEDRKSTHSWIDVVSASTSKEQAIPMARRELGIAEDAKLVVLGNGENDLGMMRIADLALCPAGSAACVQEQADVVIDAECGGSFLNRALEHIRASSIGIGGRCG